MYFVWCMSYDKSYTKKYSWLNIFAKNVFSGKKISLVSQIFPIIPIYNFNKIYVGNPQIKLFHPKLNSFSQN